MRVVVNKEDDRSLGREKYSMGGLHVSWVRNSLYVGLQISRMRVIVCWEGYMSLA